MIGDIWTLMWKEWHELLAQRLGRRTGWLSLLIMILVLGIFPPLEYGQEWVTSPFAVAFAAWMPLFLVTGVIADSIAGERERHTLETLLASRLSDTAIVLGKIGAGVSYGWGLAMLTSLISLVTVNVVAWQGHVVSYPLAIGGTIAGLALLTASFGAGLGVLVSLRASSARQAQQTMGIAMMLLMLLPLLVVQFLPKDGGAQVALFLEKLDWRAVLLGGAGLLLLVDVLLLVLAMARFRRTRLILD
jgi:ABC-2 type transport system permease protein